MDLDSGVPMILVSLSSQLHRNENLCIARKGLNHFAGCIYKDDHIKTNFTVYGCLQFEIHN